MPQKIVIFKWFNEEYVGERFSEACFFWGGAFFASQPILSHRLEVQPLLFNLRINAHHPQLHSAVLVSQ